MESKSIISDICLLNQFLKRFVLCTNMVGHLGKILMHLVTVKVSVFLLLITQ